MDDTKLTEEYGEIEGENDTDFFQLKKMSKSKSIKFEMNVDELASWELPQECCDILKEEQARRGIRSKTMVKNRMSCSWFDEINLDSDQQKQLCFGESLLMVDEMGISAGKMYATVSLAEWKDQPCLCAHSGSYGKLEEGIECGTTITGLVDFQMKPLQEYVYEWAVSQGKVIERKTYITKEDSTLQVHMELIEDGETIETKDITLGESDQQHLVTESVNIILLRWIMLDKRMYGGMALKTLTFQGKVVKNKYTELGNGWETIKGSQVKVWSIRRTVEFDFGDRFWDSVFNQHARLMLRCQPKNTHALIPLWFEPVKDPTTGTIIELPPYMWTCDAELHSKYLLKKNEVAGINRSYLLDHPELRALLSDFLQALLLRKPTNILGFAQQYFETFLKIRPEDVSTEESSESSESSRSLRDEGDEGENAGEFDYLDEILKTDPAKYYNVKPMISDDGMVQISDDDDLITLEGPKTGKIANPDQHVAVSDGQYVVTEE